MKRQKITIFLLLVVELFVSNNAYPCTGIRIKTFDDTIIYARTLEWRDDLESKIMIVPRGFSYQGSSHSGMLGASWKSQYATIGINVSDYPHMIDGINEQGLAAGLFSFHDNIEYNVPENDSSRDLAPWEFITYILSNFSTVREVEEAVKNIRIVPVLMPEQNEVPPLHYIVHDAQGKCIVLEHISHEIKVHRNELGVITNSPTFDWHLTNLSNYLNRSQLDAVSSMSITRTIVSVRSGEGVMDLPAGFHSPARFIRAVLYTQRAPLVLSGLEGVLQAFHILNQFDIPQGVVRGINSQTTITHWTSAADLKQKKYYFRTYQNQRIREINLMDFNLTNTNLVFISMDGEEDIQRIGPC